MQASGIKTTNSFAQICRCRWNVDENVHGSATMGFKLRWHHLSSLLARNPTLYWFNKQAYSTFYMCKIMQLSRTKGQLLVSNIDGTTWAHSWRGTLLCNGLLSKLTPHYTCAKPCNYHGQKGQLFVSNIDGTTWAHCWRGTLLCNGLISKRTPNSTCAKSCNYHIQKANYLFQT